MSVHSAFGSSHAWNAFLVISTSGAHAFPNIMTTTNAAADEICFCIPYSCINHGPNSQPMIVAVRLVIVYVSVGGVGEIA